MHVIEDESSPIKAMHYSREGKWLIVLYEAGGLYMYFDVTEYLYRRLLLNQNQPWLVLGNLHKHPFKRLTKW